MKIKSVKIKNFRSYEEETELNFNDLTVLVGKNDIGKSTILEALDIFFNDGNGVIKIDKTDLNTHASDNGDNETVISVCFSELPELIVIDSSVQTTLAREYMLNSDGFLEVIKKYKNGGKASVFIRAKHPTNTNCKDLLLKKNTDLKQIIASKNIECENLTGWLIDNTKVDDFNKIFSSNTSIGDEWADDIVLAKWSKTGDLITVKFI